VLASLQQRFLGHRITGNPLAAYPPFLAGLAVSVAARRERKRKRKRAENIAP
jgi:hypothetical protein